MRSNLSAGAIAGLVAGLTFGVMMQLMRAPAPGGGEVPMMAMVAKVVGSESLVVAWLYHLFNSALIGGIFGWLLGRSVGHRMGRAAAVGAGYGAAWWVLGALILMPLALGMAPFAALTMAPMRPVALGSLLGHLLYGVVLGTTFVWLRAGVHRAAVGRHA